jgi:DNA-binding response OmpR family regulator
MNAGEPMPQTHADLAVLVVDDNMSLRNDLERKLKEMGCTHIEQADCVQQARSKLEDALYDIVFLDWNMPGRSGYSLLQQCREDSRYDKTAFVIVSSMSEDRYIIEALKAGATSYIPKPVERETLSHHMERLLRWLGQRSGEDG